MKPEPCTVSGRVVSAADGQPIKSARVGLIQERMRERPTTYATTSNDDGTFVIKQVVAGRYHFMAAHAGYITQEYQSKGRDDGAILSLSPGQVVDDAMFRLVRGAAVSGRVVDETGEPLMNVYVSTLRKPTEDELESLGPRMKPEKLFPSAGATTDDRGEYRIYGLNPGEYYLKASESNNAFGRNGMDVDMMDILQRNAGAAYAPLFYPGVLHTSEAQAIALSAGQEMQADFAMRKVKTVQVSGHVIAADGKPSTRAWVNLSSPDEDSFTFDSSRMTDGKGEFIIKGVPPGSYQIMSEERSENHHAVARQKVEVGEADIDSIVLTFGAGVNITGQVRAASSGVALDRVHVFLTPTGDESVSGGWAEVKADGTFEISSVPDGSYGLMAGLREPGWYVQSARMGAHDALQNGIQVEQGSAPGKLEIVIAQGGAQLEGLVTQDDKPVVGATVRVRAEPETAYNRMRGGGSATDQNGHFKMENLPPGKYKVVAKLRSESPDVVGLSSEPQIVTLADHDHQAVQLKMPKPKEQ